MIKKITIHSLEQWRQWLQKNHLTEEKVFLISFKKHTGKSSISHREQLIEALCFGWVDTTIKKIDEDRFGRYFVKRKVNATWSKNTLRYAEQLFKQGKMSPCGEEAYLRGRKKKPIDHDVPQEFIVPVDLQQVLNKNDKAKETFAAYSPSVRKMHLKWLHSAKRAETRQKRIRLIANAAAKGKKVW